MSNNIKRIHVNQHHLRANLKAGNQDLPVFTVKTSGGNTTCNEVEIKGPSKMIYSDDPLNCGARIWLEAKCDVVAMVDGEEVVL